MSGLLGVVTMVGLMTGLTTPASADVITLMWLQSKSLCEVLTTADCVVAEDGWTLAIIDPAVTLFNAEDCVDLPKDHGRFVALVADAADEHRFPGAVEELGTGTCASGVPDDNDRVGAGEDWLLVDPIDATLRHRSSGGWDGDAMFYDPGLGACGVTSSSSDLVFALPASEFDPSPGGNPNHNHNCGRRAEVTRDGRSMVTVTVVDRCAGCAYGDIDLSPTAFQQLGGSERSEGRVKVTWSFIS
jgi:hypothetical protein